MKQKLLYLLAALGFLLPTRLSAFEVDGIYYAYQYSNDDKGNTVTMVYVEQSPEDNKYSGDIVIPSSVEYDGRTYPVTSISGWAFNDSRSLTSIEIPNSVTSIGEYAFAHCTSLTSIEIPNSVTSIGEYAFAHCTSLSSVEIPNSVTSIGSGAFYDCTSLTSIEIPNSVTSIGSDAFYGCSSLTSVNLPEVLTKIEYRTFYECTSLTSVEIPDAVTTIEELAFYYCKILTSVKLPDGLTILGDQAFCRCSSLLSIEIPKSVISIGNQAFQECLSLTSVEIPNSVTSIGSYAFAHCTSLSSVKLPADVTKIEGNVFDGCSSLTSVEIPNSVTSIGMRAFTGCPLTRIEIPSSVTSIEREAFSSNSLRLVVIKSEKIKFESDIFGYSKPWYVFVPERLDCSALECNVRTFDPETTIFMEDGTILADNGKKLLFTPVYAGSSYSIPEGVSKIIKGAFGSMDAADVILNELTIPSTIEEIEPNAFLSSQIEKVNFTDWSKWYANVKLGNLYSNPYWNSKPYVGGVLMETPELRDGITEIPDYINYGLQFKNEIEIPRSIKRIGAYAFCNNKELFSVILPAGLEEIGESAFEGCELLENPSFPSGLKTIEDGAYKDCTSISEIVLPEGLSKLGVLTLRDVVEEGMADWRGSDTFPKGIFMGCTSLEKAVVVCDIDYLDDNLFNGCTALDKIYFPLELKTIGESAFENCRTLDEITFPSTLEYIGDRAFCGDDQSSGMPPQLGNLSKLILPDAVKHIGSYAFACQRIATLSIGKSLESISDHAFYNNPSLKVINFSEGLKEIGGCAFGAWSWDYGIRGLGAVVMPSTVTKIGEGAFEHAFIRSLDIPDKVETLGPESCGIPSVLTIGSGIKEIDANAFSFGKNHDYFAKGQLYTIRLKAHMPPTLSAAFPLTQEQNDQLTLIVNKDRHDTYNTSARWKQINRIIEEGESEVTVYLDGTYSLSEEIRIQSGYMPSVITKMKVVGPLTDSDLRVIKENMVSLTSLDLSDVTNISTLPEGMFAESLLTDVVLPSNLESIGNESFRDCRLLKLTELPATVKKIGNNAFSDCPVVNLTSLPIALQTIGDNAFSNSGMKEVVGGATLSEIGSSAFSNCKLLERADLSETAIKIIQDNTFSGCSELDEILLPKSVESIGQSAFSNTALRNIDFASEVETIGDNAFSNNRRLVSATLPEDLTRVGSNLFSNCPRLISVSMPMTTTSVGANILSSDRKLANLSCSASEAPEAESGAFNDLRYRYVTLTIPTLSFRKYLSAPQWGKFENIRNTIQVSVGKGVKTTNAAEDEYQDMVKEDELEAEQEAAAQQKGEVSPARVMRRAAARAKSVQNFAALFDGATLMAGDIANRVFITPEPGVNVTSILLDDKELLSTYDGVSILLPEGCTGALKIITDAKTTVDAESVVLSEARLELTEGQTAKLTATVSPDNATDKTVTWTSSDASVASVDAEGNVKALKAGTATITITTSNGKTATCQVTVVAKAIDVTGITLDATELSLNEGETVTLTASVAPADATDKTVKWTSSDAAVVTVDVNGKVTAVKAGTATITATSANGKTATCQVTVVAKTPEVILVESLTIDPTVWNGEEGSEFRITATVLPKNATDKTLTWTSSDESVATVDGEGNVKVLKEGTCTITVATTDGSNLTAECLITSLAGVETIFGEDAVVDVYDMNGILVKKGCERGELQQLLTPGVYVLKSGNATVKAVIR